MQVIDIGQGHAIDGLGNDSGWNGGNDKEENELKTKIGQGGNLIASKGQKVEKQEIGQQTGLKKGAGQILTLIGKGHPHGGRRGRSDGRNGGIVHPRRGIQHHGTAWMEPTMRESLISR